MTTYYLLAILVGIVLRWITTAVVAQYVKTNETPEQLRTHAGFNVAIGFYILGSSLKYAGLALTIASYLKNIF